MNNIKTATIFNLNRLARDYEGLTKLIVSAKNRLQSLSPEMEVKHDPFLSGEIESKDGQTIKHQGLESIKGQLTRRIEKELNNWPIWTEWMINILGIGPTIASQLILLYYYRFVPVCPDCKGGLIKKAVLNKSTGKEFNTLFCEVCQKSVKGEGNLRYKIEIKDFPNISSWWHYMGRPVVNGEMPKRISFDKFRKLNPELTKEEAKEKFKEENRWSTRGREVGYQIGDQFNRQKEDHPYKAFLLKQKVKHLKKNDSREVPWKKGHIQNAGRNEAAKLFLSHFWQVARTLDGLPVTEPYVGKHMGHDVIPPYYWKDELKKAA